MKKDVVNIQKKESKQKPDFLISQRNREEVYRAIN